MVAACNNRFYRFSFLHTLSNCDCFHTCKMLASYPGFPQTSNCVFAERLGMRLARCYECREYTYMQQPRCSKSAISLMWTYGRARFSFMTALNKIEMSYVPSGPLPHLRLNSLTIHSERHVPNVLRELSSIPKDGVHRRTLIKTSIGLLNISDHQITRD